MLNRPLILVSVLVIAGILISACTPAPIASPTPTTSSEFVFGIIMVGPYNDHGWSEAHYTAGQYVESHLPNSRMVYLDSLNPNDRPDLTLNEAVDNMVAQNARMIFITSDDFSADTYVVAQSHPNLPIVHISGDHVLKGNAPANIGNYMGRMEYGKMIAGCAAALTTETNSISYLGPLINDETRRLADSAYLGARYCYENIRQKDPEQLRFDVEWIGFWFNIPGVTSDPTQVANQMFDQSVDVVISGIDTTEAMLVTKDRAAKGEKVWAIPYDYEGACDVAPQVCLGVPYFNWGPGYLKYATQVMAGTWAANWEWEAPNWADLNNRDTSAVGFKFGPALTDKQTSELNQFIAGLANGTTNLFKGPLNFQDNSPFLNEGEVATDKQIWYMPQLLQGMTGLSQ